MTFKKLTKSSDKETAPTDNMKTKEVVVSAEVWSDDTPVIVTTLQMSRCDVGQTCKSEIPDFVNQWRNFSSLHRYYSSKSVHFLNYIKRYKYMYEVCKLSNETFFYLPNFFIFFKHQCYPLQNSSLEQLHTDEDVFPTFANSAGSLQPA